MLLGTVLKPCASGLSRFSRRVLGLFLHRSAGTHINLSNGLLYYHGVVMFPSPILASPLNHGTQSITGPLSLGQYTLYVGGPRQAAVISGV